MAQAMNTLEIHICRIHKNYQKIQRLRLNFRMQESKKIIYLVTPIMPLAFRI